MSIAYIFIIFLIIVVACWIVYKYIPEPPKTVLLWILGIAMICWVLQLLGFWNWIAGVKV